MLIMPGGLRGGVFLSFYCKMIHTPYSILEASDSKLMNPKAAEIPTRVFETLMYILLLPYMENIGRITRYSITIDERISDCSIRCIVT